MALQYQRSGVLPERDVHQIVVVMIWVGCIWRKKMKHIEIEEVEYTACDFCGHSMEPRKCKDCGKDMCLDCQYRSSGYCKECWGKNSIEAEISIIVDPSDGMYGSRTYTHFNLHKSEIRWKELLMRFAGDKVKITFEKVE